MERRSEQDKKKQKELDEAYTERDKADDELGDKEEKGEVIGTKKKFKIRGMYADRLDDDVRPVKRERKAVERVHVSDNNEGEKEQSDDKEKKALEKENELRKVLMNKLSPRSSSQ